MSQPLVALTPVQCRQGRGLLGWSVAGLAGRSAVAVAELPRFEQEVRGLERGALGAIARALEGGGLELEDGGVRLREEPSAEEAILPGPTGEAT